MTTVKHFHGAMVGAPVLSGTAGSLIAVLDACLVTGFGLKSADSVTVAGGIATLTISTGHSFKPDTIALIAGATPTGLNGEQRVLTTSTNTITFGATGIADGAATGTITAKLAPAGWMQPYSGANVGVFRPSSVESSRLFLRVDDSLTTHARVVGYESMTDVNTGVSAFPTDAQVAGGTVWPKSELVGAVAVPWELFADPAGFYLSTAPLTPSDAGYAGRAIVYYGDIISQRASGDAYRAVLLGYPSTSDYAGGALRRVANPTNANAAYIARSHTQVGGSLACGMFSPLLGAPVGGVDSTYSGADAYCGTYPNAVSNALVVSPLLLLEGQAVATASWRGTFPGLLHSPQKITSGTFATGDRVLGEGNLSGRTLVAVAGPPTSSLVLSSVGFIDATGPWR